MAILQNGFAALIDSEDKGVQNVKRMRYKSFGMLRRVDW
jgi:hypothetical protein